MKNAVNTEFQHRGGVKHSSSAPFQDLIKRFFESLKKKCRELSLVNSESTTNKQVLSSRINEVHCGILEHAKRYRNTSHKTIINCFIRQSGMTHFVKCVAFTLAETLVVMGIIGVVAALTIPNLNQSTGDREKVAKLKKVYANLTDAFGRATAVYGPIDEWFINLPEGISANQRLADRMTEFMKISKNCGTEGSGCFPDDDYRVLDGNSAESPINWDLEPMYLLADGTAIDFFIGSLTCNDTIGQLNGCCGLLYVDIDGIKGPNTLGKDYFMFHVAKSGIYPQGAQILHSKSANYGEFCFGSGSYCAGWVIEMGNMDYLKADRQGKCPNGTTLSVDNPTCK